MTRTAFDAVLDGLDGLIPGIAQRIRLERPPHILSHLAALMVDRRMDPLRAQLLQRPLAQRLERVADCLAAFRRALPDLERLDAQAAAEAWRHMILAHTVLIEAAEASAWDRLLGWEVKGIAGLHRWAAAWPALPGLDGDAALRAAGGPAVSALIPLIAPYAQPWNRPLIAGLELGQIRALACFPGIEALVEAHRRTLIADAPEFLARLAQRSLRRPDLAAAGLAAALTGPPPSHPPSHALGGLPDLEEVKALGQVGFDALVPYLGHATVGRRLRAITLLADLDPAAAGPLLRERLAKATDQEADLIRQALGEVPRLPLNEAELAAIAPLLTDAPGRQPLPQAAMAAWQAGAAAGLWGPEPILDSSVATPDQLLACIARGGLWEAIADRPSTVSVVAQHLGDLYGRWRQEAVLRGATGLAGWLELASLLPGLPEAAWTLTWRLGLPAANRRQRALLAHGRGDIAGDLLALLPTADKAERAGIIAWLNRVTLEDHHIATLLAQLPLHKDLATRADMLLLAQRVGADITPHLDAQTAASLIDTVLKTKPVQALRGWFPFDAMARPLVRAETGEALPEGLATALVHRAAALKAASGDGPLALTLGLLRRDQAEALAALVFEQWLARSLSPDTPNELAPGVGSKIRGLLAIPAAVGAPASAVPRILALFRKAKGNTRLECMALMEVLAGIGTPAALQVIFAGERRLKADTVQAFAAELIEAVAARRRWTRDDLEDATVPDFGLDRTGTRTLSYGDSQFTLRLDGDFQPLLFEGDRALKALPAARKADDPALAKEAKAVFTALKRDVATTLELQTERLRAAMIRQRMWRGPAWAETMLPHPITGRLMQRLIWSVHPGPAAPPDRFVRPAEDLSLLDAGGDTVTLGDGDVLRLAHTLVMPEGVEAAWAEHLGDFEVRALFAQLSRGPCALLELARADPAATRLTLAEAPTTTFAALRAATLARGWERGPVLDAGGFQSYRRRWPGMAAIAEVELSEWDGVAWSDPEHLQQPVQVQAIGFDRTPLGRVPEILLYEAWFELQALIAQLGRTGGRRAT